MQNNDMGLVKELAMLLTSARQITESKKLDVIGFSYSKFNNQLIVQLFDFEQLQQVPGIIQFEMLEAQDSLLLPVKATVNYKGVSFFTLLNDEEALEIWPEYTLFAKEA